MHAGFRKRQHVRSFPYTHWRPATWRLGWSIYRLGSQSKLDRQVVPPTLVRKYKSHVLSSGHRIGPFDEDYPRVGQGVAKALNDIMTVDAVMTVLAPVGIVKRSCGPQPCRVLLIKTGTIIHWGPLHFH